MSGVVKTYNAEKGYGFISAPNMAEDIYFKSVEPIALGTSVAFKLRWSAQGKAQAYELGAGYEAAEEVAGLIRSYSSKNGYGFISVDGKAQDVYFKKDELPDELKGGEPETLVGCMVQFAVALQNKDSKPMAK